MNFYKVTYLTEDNEKRTTVVESESPEGAASEAVFSRFDCSEIIKIECL